MTMMADPENMKSETFRLIVVQPDQPSKVIAGLFPGMAPTGKSGENGAACRELTADGISVTVIPAQPPAELHAGLLSRKADALLLVVDGAKGVGGGELWSLLTGCLGAFPRVVVAVGNSSSSERHRRQCDIICKRLEVLSGNIGCANLRVKPVDLAGGEGLRELLGEIRAQHGLAAKTRSEDGMESDQFAVYLNWTANAFMLPGRHYVFDNGREQSEGYVSALKFRFNPETLDRQAAKRLYSGEIGYANISLEDAVPFAPLSHDRGAGSFVLRDKETGEVVAYGLIRHSLRRATNIRWQDVLVNKHDRARLNGHKPFVLWFTGLSGSGKSTIAARVDAGCTRWACAPTCSMAITCATACAVIWDSLSSTGWRTCAASAR